MDSVIIGLGNISINDVVKVARFNYKVEISASVYDKIQKSRDYVENLVKQKKTEYGITTGFGKFADVRISAENIYKLQRNLIVSHACGVGEEFDAETVRAIMFLRAVALSKGYSGVRPIIVETLVQMLNKKVYPVIYQKGSLGASGDLVPLAHMTLVLIGEGEAYYNGEKLPGKIAMEKAGIEPVCLAEKEGLALINGTQAMTAVGCFAIYDALNLMKAADIIASMTVEVLRSMDIAFDPMVNVIRPHKGQTECATNLRRLISGSSLITAKQQIRVQDAYTIRCIPQIHGASRDAINFVKSVLEIEINSVTDNPLIFPDDDKVISAGNFHGQPIALPMDFLGIALSEFANVSERRIERLVNLQLNDLPPFLTTDGGLNSGFMITQYTAAALVSENKVLSHPASVDSIPSSANQEDHVSMGTIAARKAKSILQNSSKVLAIEYLAAAQAFEFREKVTFGAGTGVAYRLIREHIQPMVEDRIMYTDISKAEELIITEQLVKAVEEKIGSLQ